jgi:hypothetical protein
MTQVKNNFHASVSYDTARNSHSFDAYRAFIFKTDEDACPFTQNGPVCNDRVNYSGVFTTLEGAVLALVNYISAPHEIHEITDQISGDKTFGVFPPRHKTAYGSTAVLLARKTEYGIYTAKL